MLFSLLFPLLCMDLETSLHSFCQWRTAKVQIFLKGRNAEITYMISAKAASWWVLFLRTCTGLSTGWSPPPVLCGHCSGLGDPDDTRTYSGHTALSGRTDTRTSALLSEESMLFHLLPLRNETRTSSSETCLCLIPVSSLLTFVNYPGKPTFWRQHENQLMGWLNVYLE